MDATTWDERYREQDLVWSATPNGTVAAETADLVPGRALDLACGEGRNAVWLAERGWDVEAVDFSGVALDKGGRIAADRGVHVTWRQEDLTGLPPLERADLVLLAYLHLARPVLRAVHRHGAGAVAGGGTLLIVGHARANLDRGTGGPQDPDVLLDADEVIDDLAGTGLVIETAGEIERPVDADEATVMAVDLLVRASRPATG